MKDISWTISEKMTVYKDKPAKRPQITTTKKLSQGANESRIRLDSHTGTHVDAPKHFISNGKTIDNIPLLLGPCRVIDLTRHDVITEEILAKHNIKQGQTILLKTKNSKRSETARFDKKFAYLDKTGAAYLASKKIKAVGIDGLGIERGQPKHETHKQLLSKGIIIIEGLRLQRVKAGTYQWACLPLKIRKGDAAPARAVLL